MRKLLALGIVLSGIVSAAEALATDVSNYTFNPYAYRTIAPSALQATPSVSPIRPSVPQSAALPLPDNGACVGLCRLFELMWRLERQTPHGPVPTS